MPQGPAARVGDPVTPPHLPTMLGPGPGSLNVLIGNKPAWRGMPLAAAAGVMATKTAGDIAVTAAIAAKTAAMGTPGLPAAQAAEETAKATATANMTAALTGGGAGADQHMCTAPLVPPTVPTPHGMGMVITGSPTVLINNLPACRAGDTILECLGPPNAIAMGQPNVLIGDVGMGGGGAPPPPAAGTGAAAKTGAAKTGAEKLAAELVDVAGSADKADAALVAAELAKLPEHVLQRLKDNKVRVKVARGSVTDYQTHLKGVQPRGWPPGKTWDSVPGLYDPSKKEVVIAVTGHGTKAGPHVPKTGEGHGSQNLVIHETMHAVDATGDGGDLSANDKAFKAARNSDLSTLSAYERQGGDAGPEETYAESAARYYGGDPNDEKSHPNLHKYWDSDPLKPVKPRTSPK